MLKRVLILFFLASTSFFAQIIGPKIYAPAEKYDFGDIKKGDVVKHKFYVFNIGGDSLKIYSVLSSCGCTVARVGSKNLGPNDSTSISIEFNSKGKSGKQEKYITIKSNDTLNNGTFQLTITGNVVEVIDHKLPKIEFEKDKFDFGSVQEGTKLEYTFNFKNTGGSDLEIGEIQTSCGCTVASISSKTIKPGESGNIKVVFDTTNKSGKTTRTISVPSID
jgi:hypothetical protein